MGAAAHRIFFPDSTTPPMDNYCRHSPLKRLASYCHQLCRQLIEIENYVKAEWTIRTHFPALPRQEHTNSPPSGTTEGFGMMWRGSANISGPLVTQSMPLSDGTISCWPSAISSGRGPGGSAHAGLTGFLGSSPASPAPL